MNFSLIVPIAADKAEYDSQLPPVFSFDMEGIIFCIKAILGLNLKQFTRIYFTILRSHDEHFGLSDLLKIQIRRLQLYNAKVVVLNKNTTSQAETVYETIKLMDIKGAIFIKDSDTFFKGDIMSYNGVAIYPLEKLDAVNPQHKSYVAVDDQFYVTNIIERKIISHYFNAGGYCFEDVTQFCDYYNKLKSENGLFLSHIIYDMLLDKTIFRPFLVQDYIDFERLNK